MTSRIRRTIAALAIAVQVLAPAATEQALVRPIGIDATVATATVTA